MSFLRIWTDVDSYTDTTHLWDVNIDAEQLSGATYYSQESRSATLTMPYPVWFSTYLDADDKPAVLPLVFEIYEDFSYANANNQIVQHNSMKFRGYLFRNDCARAIVGVHIAGNTQTEESLITITIRDWLAVFKHYIETPYTYYSGIYPVDVDNRKQTLTANSTINVADELIRIWNLAGAACTNLGTIWSPPDLVNALQFNPNYGFDYDNVEIIRQAPLNHITDGYASALHYIESAGILVYEDVRYRYGDFVGGWGWKTEWYRWEIYQGGYTLYNHVTHTGSWGSTAPFYGDYEAIDYATNGYYSDYQGVWDSSWQQPYSINQTPQSGAQLIYHLETLQDSNGVDFTRLLMDGIVNFSTIIVGGADIEVDTLAWFRYLLDINFSCVRYGDSMNVYFIKNKTIVNSTAYQWDTGLKLLNYNMEIDGRVEDAGSGIDGIINNQVYVDKMNEYARQVFTEYEKVLTFSTNQEAELGAHKWLPEYHNQPVHITEKSYDLNQPFVWHYKGRAK